MLTLLPRWVESCVLMLALMAGVVNVVGILGFQQQAVSHLTGSSSWLAVDLLAAHWSQALFLLGILLSFVLGAALSSWLIREPPLQLAASHVLILAIEAALLALACLALSRHYWLGQLLACAACGLQNAMVSLYSGALIRVTHVSGLFTDLGLMFGDGLKGLPVEARRLKLALLVIGGFIAGGLLGAWSFGHWQFDALLGPAVLALLLALTCWYWVRQIRDQA